MLFIFGVYIVAFYNGIVAPIESRELPPMSSCRHVRTWPEGELMRCTFPLIRELPPVLLRSWFEPHEKIKLYTLNCMYLQSCFYPFSSNNYSLLEAWPHREAILWADCCWHWEAGEVGHLQDHKRRGVPYHAELVARSHSEEVCGAQENGTCELVHSYVIVA